MVALRVLDVSWNEPNTASLFLPDTADVVKEREQNYEVSELQVC